VQVPVPPARRREPGAFRQFRLETDGGTWIGVLDPDAEMTLFWCTMCGGLHGDWPVEYPGTGAYEGLVYREHVEHSYTGDVSIDGWIEPASGNWERQISICQVGTCIRPWRTSTRPRGRSRAASSAFGLTPAIARA
jgi:hypothetical protein